MLATEVDLPYVVAVNPAQLSYVLPAAMAVYGNDSLILSLEDSDGIVVFEPELSTHYTVTKSVTGTVTITFLSAAELLDGRWLVVDRRTPRTQGVRFSELQELPGFAIENAVDRITAILQEMSEALSRALLVRRGETPDTSELLALAEDLALGDEGAVAKLALIIPALEALGDLDVELSAIYLRLVQIEAVAAALAAGTVNLFSDVLPRGARTSNPSVRNDGTALQVGDEWYRSDLDQPMRYYGDGARIVGFMDTKELTNFVPESVRSAVFGASVDAMPYIMAAHAQLGDGGRLILPGGTFDLRSQGQITANGFTIMGGGRAAVLRQNYADGHPFVIGRTDAGSAQSQDIAFSNLILFRSAGNHAFFETTKMRTFVLDDVEWSNLYALAVLGRAGLGAPTYQLWMQDSDGAMDATGHGTGIEGVYCAGGVYSSRVFTEARHDVSAMAWIDFTPNSANIIRADGITIEHGNVKGWKNAIRHVDSRVVNIECTGARFDEMGEAAYYAAGSASPAVGVDRIGFESVKFIGCVNGSGNLANNGFVRVLNETNGAVFASLDVIGCSSNRLVNNGIDIETHASNGAKVEQVNILGYSAGDTRMSDGTKRLVRLKNDVRKVHAMGVNNRTNAPNNAPLHLVDLDVLASVDANSIVVAGNFGDVYSGGSVLRDPQRKATTRVSPRQHSGDTVEEVRSGIVADDAVVTIHLGTDKAGRIEVEMGGTRYATFVFETIAPSSVAEINKSASDVAITTGALTGTTGTDGNMTVSVDADTLYIENRRGGSQFWSAKIRRVA